MTDLPAPPVPADCDLRSYTNIPLDAGIISRLHNSFEPDECWYMMKLIQSSWAEQIPTTSLPNDMAALAKICGKNSQKMREKILEILKKYDEFVLCYDNRWYHKTLAKAALSRWKTKTDAKPRKDAFNDRQKVKNAFGTHLEESRGEDIDIPSGISPPVSPRRDDPPKPRAKPTKPSAEPKAKLTTDFVPGQEVRALGIAELGEARAGLSLAKFIDHFTAGRGRNETRTADGWQRRLDLWFRQDAEHTPRNQAGQVFSPGNPPLTAAQQRLEANKAATRATMAELHGHLGRDAESAAGPPIFDGDYRRLE